MTGHADLVGIAEIAHRAGVQRDTVHAWRQRHADFPKPIAELAMGPVWSWPNVASWLDRPRPSGVHRDAAQP